MTGIYQLLRVKYGESPMLNADSSPTILMLIVDMVDMTVGIGQQPTRIGSNNIGLLWLMIGIPTMTISHWSTVSLMTKWLT